MMMEHQQQHQHRRTTPSPYLYDVDPGLHASQKPSEVPRVKRNLVQNLVDKFNEEAKQRELCRHHSVDDSLITNHHQHHQQHQHHQHHQSHRSPANGVIEANADNAPNHNHPFSYTTTSWTSNKDRSRSTTTTNGTSNGVLAGQRSRSEFNIGPSRKSPSSEKRRQPAEVIYAQVMVNGGANADKSRRTKTTVHTKVPNRMATAVNDESRAFTKSTGSLNMSAHEEQDDLDRQQLKNGNYYRYAEVDENIHRGNSRKSGGSASGSGRYAVVDFDFDAGRRRTLDPIADNRLDGKAYETRNVDKWSESEVKPHSRKYTEHEYVHEVSVSRDDNNKMTSPSPSSSPLSPMPIMAAIPKEDYSPPKSRERSRVERREEHKSQSENEHKWHSLYRNNGHIKGESRWKDIESDHWRRPATIDKHGRQSDTKNYYYFGQTPDIRDTLTAPDKPPRQKWRHDLVDDGGGGGGGGGSGRRYRRNSEESAASSGVGLLSSKLVKKANERLGGISTDFSDGGHASRSPFPSRRRRRLSEGDSDIFPPPSQSFSRRFDDDDDDDHRDLGLVEYDANGRIAGNGFTEESRKVTRREETETHTRHRRTRTTTRHRSPHEDHHRRRHHDDHDYVDDVDDVSSTGRKVHRQNGDGRPEEQPIIARRHQQQQQQQNMQQRQTEVHERSSSSSSASRRGHQRLHQQVHRHHSDATIDDKMETSESEQPLYGGSQESRMSLGSRLSLSADNEMQRPTDDVNTPQSVVRQMDKRQINYENAQHHRREITTSTQGNKSNTGGRRFWFERSTDDDARNNNSSTSNNKNLKNSNEWTSATLSRLETNKNHRNGYLGGGGLGQGGRWASNTIDRNDVRQQKQQQQQQRNRQQHNGHEIRIQVNDEDVAPVSSGGRSRSSSSYHSESESQVSPGAKTKRVNFKSKSTANLSPVHREALLRSASPARAPSVSGSLRSNESDGSHVIQHATAVADIPPAREYRLRSANTSPSPPASSIGVPSSASVAAKKKESRTVRRSFSLLAPWKPRKYRNESPSPSPSPSLSAASKRSAKNGSAPNLMHDGVGVSVSVNERPRGKASTMTTTSFTSSPGNASPQVHFKTRSGDESGNEVRSRDSSSEKLDSLSPLPSESASKSKKRSGGGIGRSGKKKNGLLRRHSMPKDSRFANFFRRKKDKEAKK